MSLQSGTRVGPYEIVEPLGAGGMGEVYLADDPRLGRRVAIKVLPEEFAGDPERLARFEQEARAAAALNHPHIAAVFDVGVEPGVEPGAAVDAAVDAEGAETGVGSASRATTLHFMVQELLEGDTLREVIERGPLDLGRALHLCIEIAEALSAAHGAGIVHRDLKPANVFVSKDGHAKVLDFGLAKLTELAPLSSPDGATRSPTMIGTAAGQVMGTAGYMAPEQVEGGEVDHRADLFAFGVLLFEMTTGRQPFAGRNVIDTLNRIANLAPESLHEIDGALPADLARILDKALAKDPAARYQSAADVAVDLRRLAADVEADRATPIAAIGATAATPVEGVPYWGVAAATVAALLLGLAGGVRWLAPEPAPTPLRTFTIDYPEGVALPLCCARNVEVAPDGSFLVYAAEFEGERQLFLRRMDQLETVRLGAIGQAPTISPDGEWVAYQGSSDGERGLFKIALAGGDPFRLASDEEVRSFDPIWGDDGWIYVAGSISIHRVPAAGGAAETVVPRGEDTDGSRRFMRATPLPGGEALLLQASGSSSMVDARILLWRIGADEPVELVAEGTDPRYVPTGHVLYVRGDTLYALPFDPDALRATGNAVPVLQGLQVDPSGAGQLAVAADGTLVWQPGMAAGAGGIARPRRIAMLGADGTVEPLSMRADAFSSPALSPDGRRVAVARREDRDGGGEVWILELAQDALARLTVGGGSTPVWSNDGAWVYFSRQEGGSTSIWRQAADFSGEAERVIAEEGQRLWPESLSPDDTRLLYAKGPPGRFGSAAIEVLDLASGESEVLVAHDEFTYGAPSFSPDGRHVVYWSSESGTAEVYVREVDGSRRWLVSTGGGQSPVWSADGSRIYYRRFTGGVILVADIAFGETLSISPPREVLSGLDFGGPYVVTEDDRLLVLADAAGGDPDAPTPTGVNVTLGWLARLRELAPPAR